MGSTRRPNRRGEGARLRAEIVTGAAAVLEDSGNEDAVTLRAVARRIGIAAPSIYGHFADRDEMLLAVIEQAFGELETALAAAVATETGDELQVVCRAYLDFATARPHRYRVMFARHRSGETGAVNQSRPAEELTGAGAFALLADAVARHRGHDEHATTRQNALALWVALHGYVSLRAAVPAFPWPDEDSMLDELIDRLA